MTERLVTIHSHARQRMSERGVSEEEVEGAIQKGESFPAKHGRLGFRCNFPFGAAWEGVYYAMKQVDVICATEGETLVVVTVIAKYF